MQRSGGGVMLFTTGLVTFSSCTINDNQVPKGSSGVCHVEEESIRIDEPGGAGVYILFGEANFSRTTIQGNEASEGVLAPSSPAHLLCVCVHQVVCSVF